MTKARRPSTTGSSSGDANRKVIVGPKGAPLLRSPARTGMLEQVQNGVIAPRTAPPKYAPTGLRFSNTKRTFSSGTQAPRSPIRKLRAKKSTTSSAVITTNHLVASSKLDVILVSCPCPKQACRSRVAEPIQVFDHLG